MRLEQLGAHIDFGPIWLVIDKGGPVVVVIGLISVVALAVALAKFMQFVGIGVGPVSYTHLTLPTKIV